MALFSIPTSPLVVGRFPFPPKTKFSFLSLSFPPCTVAVSSFQPSSAAPTSWLTHFCSEVTGFLADFPRVGLTNPYAAFRTRPPAAVLVVLTASVLHTNDASGGMAGQWRGVVFSAKAGSHSTDRGSRPPGPARCMPACRRPSVACAHALPVALTKPGRLPSWEG